MSRIIKAITFNNPCHHFFRFIFTPKRVPSCIFFKSAKFPYRHIRMHNTFWHHDNSNARQTQKKNVKWIVNANLVFNIFIQKALPLLIRAASKSITMTHTHTHGIFKIFVEKFKLKMDYHINWIYAFTHATIDNDS